MFANSQTVAARLRAVQRDRERAAVPSAAARRPVPQRAARATRCSGWGASTRGSARALLLRALPHAPEARAVFVGRGPEEEKLRRLARASSGVAGRVRFAGQVDDEALLALYAEARIVAVTAAGEDLGYVPLEAFLSGKAGPDDRGRRAARSSS